MGGETQVTRVKALFFDLGNTLTQSASLADALTEGVFKCPAGDFCLSSPEAQSLGAAVEQCIASLYRKGPLSQPHWLTVWRGAANACDLEFSDDQIEHLTRTHLAELVKRCVLRPQTLPLLSAVRQAGIPMALVSNVTGPPELFAADLQVKGLAPFFQVVVWSSALGVRKPHPRMFQQALDALDLSAGEGIVVVGDNEWADIHGGKRMGFTTIRVSAASHSRPDSEADHVVTHEGMPELLARLIAG